MFLIWNKERKNSISTSDYCYSIYFGLLSADLHHGEFFWREVRLLTDNFLEWEIRKKYFLKIAHFLWVYVSKYFADIKFLPYESKSFSGVAGEVSGKFQNIGNWFKWFEKNIFFLKLVTFPIVLFKKEWSWTYIVWDDRFDGVISEKIKKDWIDYTY
jgi:hypothetical protein